MKQTIMILGFGIGLMTMTGCSQSSTPSSTITKEREMNALFDAVTRNNGAAVDAAMTRPDVLTATNERGETLLMRAVYAQRPKIVKRLIEAGANVNAQDDRLNSPFLYAGAEGDLATVRLALAHGADFTVTNRYGGTALIPAAEKGHLAVVKLLVNTPGYPIDHVNRLGWTALLEAIILGEDVPTQTQIVALLIDAGARVDIADANGVSALTHAQQKGYTEIVKRLAQALKQ